MVVASARTTQCAIAGSRRRPEKFPLAASCTSGRMTRRSVSDQRDHRDLLGHHPPVAGQSPLRAEAEHEPGEAGREGRAAPRATSTSRPRGRGTARGSRRQWPRRCRAGTARIQPRRTKPTDVSTWAINTTRRDRRPRWKRGPGAPRRSVGAADAASAAERRAGAVVVVMRPWSARTASASSSGRGLSAYRSCGTAVAPARWRSAPTVGERPGGRCAHRGDGEHCGPGADLLGQWVRHPEGAVVHRARGSPRSPAPRAWPTGAGPRTRRRRAPRPRADGSW